MNSVQVDVAYLDIQTATQRSDMRFDPRSFHCGPDDDEPSSDSDGDSSGNPSSGPDDDMGHDGTGDSPSGD